MGSISKPLLPGYLACAAVMFSERLHGKHCASQKKWVDKGFWIGYLMVIYNYGTIDG